MNENLYPNSDLSPVSPIQEKIQTYHLEEPVYAEKVLADFKGIGFLSIAYGLFYCFCLYQNGHGITSPLWVIATIAYYVFAMKRLEIPFVKSTLFYAVSAVILGISNCLTDSAPLHFFNYTAILLLMFLVLMKHFYVMPDCNIGQYLLGLICTTFGSIGCLDGLFKSFFRFRKTNKEESNPLVRNILLGMCISVPLLFVVVLLLTCADAVFCELIFDSFLSKIVVPKNLAGIVFMILFGTFACHSILLYLARQQFKTDTKNVKTGEPVIAITFCLMLTIVYLLFCFIQVKYLFFGLGESSLPEGYTFASYARQGFFQLLFVCIINLCLVLFCLGHYKENKLLKGILTVISLCTFIMIASSAYRMILYINAYQLTFLRVIVLWALAVIFLLMCGVIVYTYQPTFPLFTYGVGIVTCFYIVLSLSRPDTYIANFNLTQIEQNKDVYLDTEYLYNLSLDAAPILAAHGFLDTDSIRNLDETIYTSDDVYEYYYEDDSPSDLILRRAADYKENIKNTYKEMTARSFNFSTYRAYQSLD